MNNFIRNHIEILKNHGFHYPEIELRTIINQVKKNKKEIILSNFQSHEINIKLFNEYFSRRINNEPISKIINKKNFWKYSFYVNQDVLDPRPETEFILESVINYFPKRKKKYKILDLGTGSGCLAISLAKEYKNSFIKATDISLKALKVAKINSKTFNSCKKINFVHCNLLDHIEKYDIIVSNPPYISTADYNNIDHGIKNYEPKKALIAGKDGLFFYKKLANIFSKICKSSSLCFVEIGHNQKSECIKIFSDFSLVCIKTVKDYQKMDRVLILKKI